MAASVSSGARFAPSARFEVVAQVGQGGAGLVYEALDHERNARVALKTLRQPDAQAILLLKHEFRALQDLSHPNLVTPKELFEHGGQWFFTMDLVRGVDFFAYVRPRGTAPGLPDEARLRDALRQVALGLSALHADHKVHRDVKPANVLVAADGRVQILDFGIVRDLADAGGADEDGEVVGTVLYMAPEQAMDLPVTPAADWYAVGVMLYQALTGALPFDGGLTDVLASKATRAPEPPSSKQPDVPADLDALCVALLHPDPAARLEGFQVLQRLGVVTGGASSMTRVRAGRFVGRRAELDAIDAAFAAARDAAEAVTLLVSGESGVGKSRLVREFTARVARDAGALVFRGRCYERESLPYKAVDTVIDELARHLAALPAEEAAALLPEDAAALRAIFPALEVIPAIAEARITKFDVKDPQAARAQMFALLRALFVNVARRRRVVLVIDDLQWADADSVALLAELLRPPDGPPLLLLASIRSATGNAGAAAMHARLATLPGDVRWVHLPPLAEGEARELIGSLLARAESDGAAIDVDAIYAEAKGHPLFIDELVRHRAAHAAGTPARLDDALWERAQLLAPSARRLLEAVAMAGVPMPQNVVAAAAALDPGQAFDAIAALRSAHFVRTSGVYRKDTVEAYHDRVRESVMGHLDPPARTQWHGRLALALEQAGDDSEKLVTHWVGAGENGRAAAAATKAAAAAAAGLAFDHAASLYRTAIELGAPTGDAAVALKVKLAEALTNAARGADAAAVYLEAAGRGTSNLALDLRRRAAEQLVCSGRIEEGTRTFEAVLKEVDVRMPRSMLGIVVSLVWSSIWIAVRGMRFTPRKEADVDPRALLRLDCVGSAGPGLGMTDHVRGRELQVRALVEALGVGEPFRVARAIAYYGLSLAGDGGPAFAKTMKTHATVLAMAEEQKSPYLEAMGYGVSAFAHYLSGEVAQSRALFERTEAILRDRCIGVTHELASARMLLYRGLAILGELPTLSRLVDVSLREAEQKGDLYSVVNFRSNCSALLALARDDVAAAQRELDVIAPHLPKQGFHVQHMYWYLARGQVWLYAGDAAKARDEIARQWRAMERSMILRLQATRVAAYDLRARSCIAIVAARGAGAAAARKEAEGHARRIAREGLAYTTAHAWVLRACLAAIDGASREAESQLRSAEEAFARLHIRLAAAAARRARGVLLGGDEGGALVADADAAMARLGVQAPARMAALYVPGIGAGDRGSNG